MKYTQSARSFLKRFLCTATALVLSVSGIPAACAETADGADDQAEETHFVPENPDMSQPAVELMPLDLAVRTAASGHARGEDTGEGVLFTNKETGKCAVKLPFTLMKGQRLKLIVTGRFVSEQDKGLRIYLTDASLDNCSNATMPTIGNNGGEFSETIELIANKPANAVMLTTPFVTGRFDGLLVTGITAEVDAETLAGVDPSVPYEKAVGTDWYQQMLTDSWVSLGNNYRLNKLIQRMQNGEHVTVATIGGSITEGAGASRYNECYAYRIFDGFRQQYGAACDVSFVNAGVGGTPSTFGWMRYQRDIVDRVKDDDGLPDLVVIEYSVNDGGEPTNHKCVESMVKQILSQPNEPVVILLFAVFVSGYNLQTDFKPIGNAYDLMMVSIKDGPFRQVGTHWTDKGFFYDEYHPTTLGHAVMADCVLSAIGASLAQPVSETDVDLTVKPAYGDSYMGIRTIYKHTVPEGVTLSVGGFSSDDTGGYTNQPVGRVCGPNFFHTRNSGNEPLTFTATFKNLLIAYRTMNDASYGRAEVYIDGKRVRTLNGNTGSWGQSVTDLLYTSPEAAEHTVTIRMAEGNEDKKFTITCLGFTP